MTDIQEAREKLRLLEEKLQSVGLAPEEHAQWEALRRVAGEDPGTASFPVPSGFEEWGAAPEASAPAPTEKPAPESTQVLWDLGPVLQPEAPLSDLMTGTPAELAAWTPEAAPSAPDAAAAAPPPPPPFPPADPAFDAVVVDVEEEAIPEVADEDVEEVAEAVAPPPAVPAPSTQPAMIATVSFLEEEPGGDVVSLDALSVTPPPPEAESLAPPLPPHVPRPRPAPASPPEFPAVAASERDPFDASPSFVSGEHRIVLHTVEGQVLRGAIANADLGDPELPMIQPNGAVARVPASQVKAIFFMLQAGQRPPEASGTRLRVTFGDGRQVSGVSPDYSPSSSGFFVLPLDARTNTARVWVYRAAIRQISVG